MKSRHVFTSFFLPALVCMTLGVVPLWAQGSTYYFPQLVNGANGLNNFYESTFSLSNVLPVANTVTMQFTRSDGTAWALDFRSIDRADAQCGCSSTTFILQPGESATFFTGGVGAFAEGWAKVQSSSPLEVSETFGYAGISGSTVYLIYEAGVLPGPPSTKFSFTANKSINDFISGTNSNTGVAIANPSGVTATITATLFDRTGTQVSKQERENTIVSKTITLAPNLQTALYIDQIFTDYTFTGRFHGTVRFSSNVNVALVALRDLTSSAGDVFSTLAVNPDPTLSYNIVYDTEPNGDFTTAQPITAPARVIGTMNSPTDSDDTDFYSINLQAGQTLFVELVADPGLVGLIFENVIKFYNPSKTQVAVNSDSGPQTRTPILSYVAPATGTYYISLGVAAGTYGRSSSYEMTVGVR
jgi:hypothetical protein